jgi:hypothetical protein
MRETLEARRIATLATQDEDGSIHLTPVWYLFEDGKFYVGMPSSSRKARNMTARSSATMMVDVRQAGSESWISAIGPVEFVKEEESRAINSKIHRRYLTQEAIENSPIGPGFAAVDDITMVLTPKSWRSWNSKDLDKQFFGGMIAANPAKWIRPTEP